MRYFFFSCILLSALAQSCKSDAPKTGAAPEASAPKDSINVEVVGEKAQLDPATQNIDISKSTTDIKRYSSQFQANGCTFVSNDLFQQVFGVAIDGNVNVNSIPEKGHCIWVWKKPNWMEIENANEKKGAKYQEFKNTMSVRVVNFQIVDAAQKQFQMILDTQGQAYTEKVDGIGEQAVWSATDNTLAARKAHLLTYLTVEVGSNAENLAKAKQIMAGGYNK
jgi:hypothetical protein